MDKAQILSAMRADSIPAAWHGRWFVQKIDITKPYSGQRLAKDILLPTGRYTFLKCLTDSTMYADPPGETVMEDTPFELSTHLEFIRRAFGSVLVTGLGLGCVIRGLLTNPLVTQITCIENSPDVLALVNPYMPSSEIPLVIIQADALEWTATNTLRFDCAWHDVWTDRSSGEPHLDLWHFQLLKNCRRFASRQGAWGFDRAFRRTLIQKKFVNWIG
jgi:hypothetical protein